MKKKKVILICIVAVIFCVGIGAGGYYLLHDDTEYVLGKKYDGSNYTFPILSGTREVNTYGAFDNFIEFRSRRSVEELQTFYDDYFSSLKKAINHSQPEEEWFYDESQDLFFKKFDFKEDGKTVRFTLVYDYYNATSNGKFSIC